MTKVKMREILVAVRAEVTSPMMRTALRLAAGLVVSKLSPDRVSWLTQMLWDMSYDCDCRGQDDYAESLRKVASALCSD